MSSSTCPEGLKAVSKILVVDDHIDLAENLAEILAVYGHDAVVAPSAEAGLIRIAVGDIHMLITDFRLPGRSGAQMIADLRHRHIQIPAVLISAYTDDDTIAAALEAGALEVLAKPVDIQHLVPLVDRLVATSPTA